MCLSNIYIWKVKEKKTKTCTSDISVPKELARSKQTSLEIPHFNRIVENTAISNKLLGHLIGADDTLLDSLQLRRDVAYYFYLQEVGVLKTLNFTTNAYSSTIFSVQRKKSAIA